MGFYSERIIPLFLDLFMDRTHIRECRKNILKNVSGEILEIGFGTGLNLFYYPESVKKITAIDKNSGMAKQAEKKIRLSNIKVDKKIVSSEQLSFEDESFDSVVSTYTLCSIRQVHQALSEIYRVLKPSGRFFFLEHGLSDNSKVQRWQHRLNPLQNLWADGCNLNRDIKSLIVNAGFEFKEFRTFYQKEEPKTLSFMYEGIAVKGVKLS